MRSAYLLAVLALAGCEPTRTAPAECALSVEATFGVLEAPIDALAIVIEDGAPVAFASARDGTFRLVEGQRPVRVAPRFEGGIAATLDGENIALAGLELPVPAAGKAGSASLLVLDRDRVVHASALGRVGGSSRGIELVQGLTAAFHDGEVGRNVARIAHAGEEARTLSRAGRISSRPWLGLDAEGRVLSMWEEGGFDAEQRPVGAVMFHAGRGIPRRIAETAFHGASPAFVVTSRGIAAAYRDERPRGAKARLYGVALDARGEHPGEVLDLGRADGEPPRLIACMGGVVTLAPRTFGDNEIIGLVYADERMTARTSEHQFYEQGSRFPRAAGVCNGDSVTLVVAELPGTDALADAHEAGRVTLRRGRFSCTHPRD